MTRVVLVGATDGIGLALAHGYLGRCGQVGLLGRSAERVTVATKALAEAYPDGVVVDGVLDVTDRSRGPEALEEVVSALGGVDLLIYCAGAIDDGGDPERMLAVNTLGAIDVLQWGAARMVESGGGRLAAIGSIAGDRGRGANAVYEASKAALHTYLEALRRRLHSAGVGVTTVKPGWVRTKMLGDVPGFPPSVSAEWAAERIIRQLERGRDTFYVPAWWALVSLALRLIPGPLFKRLGS